MHTAFEMAPRAPTISSDLKSEVSITLRCQPVNSSTNQELFEKHLCNPRIPKERIGAVRPSYINYHLKSEVSITLHCWLCSTCYTAVRIKNCFKNTSTIEVATMNITDNFRYEGKPLRTTTKSTLFAVSKMNGTQRRTPVSL